MGEPVPNPIQFEANKRLSEFFPMDDPLAPWMFRIAIVRDDLAYEIKGLGLDADASEEDTWRCAYFIRKLSVSLDEAAGLFQHEVQKYGKGLLQESPRLAKTISMARKQLVQTREAIKVVRDALGAHIRPANALSKEARTVTNAEGKMLGALGDEGGVVRVDFRDKQRTSYQGITQLSLFLLWPEASTLAQIFEKHEQVRDAIVFGGRAAMHAIDVVLASYWVHHKIIDVPDDYELRLTLPEGWPRNIVLE